MLLPRKNANLTTAPICVVQLVHILPVHGISAVHDKLFLFNHALNICNASTGLSQGTM